jgi:hypothetical protein
MFPVSVCLRIESKRFVEEETQRKRLGPIGRIRLPDLPFPAARSVTLWLLRRIPRLRFAPLGMTELI